MSCLSFPDYILALSMSHNRYRQLSAKHYTLSASSCSSNTINVDFVPLLGVHSPVEEVIASFVGLDLDRAEVMGATAAVQLVIGAEVVPALGSVSQTTPFGACNSHGTSSVMKIILLNKHLLSLGTRKKRV